MGGDILGLKQSISIVSFLSLLNVIAIILGGILGSILGRRFIVLSIMNVIFVEIIILEVAFRPVYKAIKTSRKKYKDMDWLKRKDSKHGVHRSSRSRVGLNLGNIRGNFFASTGDDGESRARELRRRAYMKKIWWK